MSFLPSGGVAVPLVWCLAMGLSFGGLPRAAAAGELPPAVRLIAGWQLQDAAKIAEPGEVLSRTDYIPSGWHVAIVPGTVLSSLVQDGVYPEPLYGENNRTIPDTLCRTKYWYRTTFIPPQSYAGKRVWLTFHGINYSAEVWVNGHELGRVQGAFSRGIFDVTAYVMVGATNALAVSVLPQPHPGATHEKTIAKGVGPNGGVTAQDGPTFLCTIGWDWIPTIRDRDTGIWQDVTLSASGPVVVRDAYVTTKLPLPRTDSADLTVQATVHNATEQPQTGVLTGSFEGATFKQNVSLAPREIRTITFSPGSLPVLHLKHPRLWWPNGFGPQNLYHLNLSFALQGKVSDSQETTFGVREIAYTVPGSPNLALSVNGVPVVAKGGDWGMDEALKRIPRRRLEAQIRFHQLANFTMIRNWVGQSTSEDFYDLCDQYGILVWDEFFQPNPADGPDPDNPELYLANVKEKILRFRNHPCVALWCARNEGDPPPALGQGIQKLIDSLDPTRLYQPSSTSGRGVNSGGPYCWRPPREFYQFEDAFKTEVGSMSVPTLEAIQAMMPHQDWEVINDDWAEHDLAAGAQEGDRYAEILASRYGGLANLADFVRKGQLANYEAFRAMYEGRFARLFHPVTGVLTWMSNPAQPSFVWQLYSHDLEPNAALYAARKACEPLHVQMNQSNWHLQVINHTPRALPNARVTLAVYNLDGTLRYGHTNALTAAPGAATDLGEIAFPSGLSTVHFVRLELRDAEQRLVSENFYWRAEPAHPDNFTALNLLPTAAVEVEARERISGGQCLLDVEVRNPSGVVALMTHLQLRQARSGRRVLPVFYSDNYLSLLPGEKKRLTIEAALADLNGESPLLAVDGWNVSLQPVPLSGKGVRVVPNVAAQARTAAASPGPAEAISINCGGGQVGFYRFGGASVGDFVGDRDFEGGNTVASAQTIDTHVAGAAPAAVYQTERWGPCTYRVAVPKGASYTVRLHFAEVRFGPGQRKFNVEINGRRVLSDLDIAAEAGQNKALVKEFPAVAPDAHGQITIKLLRGPLEEPKICGLQVLK